ncbi:MAG TPA: type 4a pilus biogenesis protein PilO [Verrucomicrobiae bacterium]|nr:type 4a pilus biogenesis protein PilO [Verrucomicrobiae bacterium]
MTHYKGAAPILLLIITIIGGYFFTYPQWTTLGVNRTALAEVQRQNELLKQSEADLQNFVRQHKSMSESSGQANKVLPADSIEIHNVLANLDQFAAASGVNLSNTSFTQDETRGTDNAIVFTDISLSFTGSYASFRAFIQQLENSLRIIDVNHINVSVGEGNNLQFQLSARVYYQK